MQSIDPPVPLALEVERGTEIVSKTSSQRVARLQCLRRDGQVCGERCGQRKPMVQGETCGISAGPVGEGA